METDCAVGLTGTFSGRLAHIDADGEDIGREWFWRKREADYNSLRAYCELDNVRVTRDVSPAMGGQMRPPVALKRMGSHLKVVGETNAVTAQVRQAEQEQVAAERGVGLPGHAGLDRIVEGVGDESVHAIPGGLDPGVATCLKSFNSRSSNLWAVRAVTVTGTEISGSCWRLAVTTTCSTRALVSARLTTRSVSGAGPAPVASDLSCALAVCASTGVDAKASPMAAPQSKPARYCI